MLCGNCNIEFIRIDQCELWLEFSGCHGHNCYINFSALHKAKLWGPAYLRAYSPVDGGP